jgi:hypothetical protein
MNYYLLYSMVIVIPLALVAVLLTMQIFHNREMEEIDRSNRAFRIAYGMHRGVLDWNTMSDGAKAALRRES